MLMFGLQFTLSFLLGFLYIRLTPYFSLSHKWLTGLEFFIPPEDKELRKLDFFAPSDKKKNKGKTKNESKEREELELKFATIEDKTLFRHTFWEEYDLCVLSLVLVIFNYIFTEFGICFGYSEKNSITVIVFLIATVVCLKIMFTLLFKLGLRSAELKLTFLVGFIAFLIALFAVELSPILLSFDLGLAYRDLCSNLSEFLEKNNYSHLKVEIPFTLFKIFLCSIAGSTTCMIFFPSFRLARSHLEMTKYNSKSFYAKISKIAVPIPLIILILWFKPFYTLFSKLIFPLDISSYFFEGLRFYLLLLLSSLRLYLLRPYIQSFLATAVSWTQIFMNDFSIKEKGKSIKFKILGVYSYIVVAAVQILTPSILLLILIFFYKSRGLSDYLFLPLSYMIKGTAFHSVNNNNNSTLIIFSPIFCHEVFSFLCWWLVFSWYILTLLALIHERNELDNQTVLIRNKG